MEFEFTRDNRYEDTPVLVAAKELQLPITMRPGGRRFVIEVASIEQGYLFGLAVGVQLARDEAAKKVDARRR